MNAYRKIKFYTTGQLIAQAAAIALMYFGIIAALLFL
jgi:hypothetical protein